jgi:hypothetical protein
MLHASDPRHRYCKRVSSSVSVCRTEEDCRREYGCTKPNCPLEKAFGMKAFDERMRAFATIFDLWPLRRSEQPPDFP